MDRHDETLSASERAEMVDATAEAIDAFAGVLDDLAEGRGFANVTEATKRVGDARSRIADLRAHILAKTNSLPEELVHVADWDRDGVECWILVRSMTAKERAQFQTQILAATPGRPQIAGQPVSINWEKFFADIVIMTARDPEDSALLFSPTDRDGLLAIAAKPIEQLASVARRLSGLEESAQTQAQFPD